MSGADVRMERGSRQEVTRLERFNGRGNEECTRGRAGKAEISTVSQPPLELC